MILYRGKFSGPPVEPVNQASKVESGESGVSLMVFPDQRDGPKGLGPVVNENSSLSILLMRY